MKESTNRVRAWAIVAAIAAACVVPPIAMAQESAATSSTSAAFKHEELEQLLAPIALYPDALVSQVLMASTYPLEIVQAERFAAQNKGLKGDALAQALEKQTWDPSVKSLVNFPQVLALLSDKLEWTQKLGDAFLAQQRDVFDAIQRLRAKAQAAGHLKSTKEQTVVVEEKVIRIEPASTQVVYVPAYNPTVVYGTWAYPAYPPYYYYPPGYAVAPLYGFGAGIVLGAAWGYAWGSTNWHRGEVNIDVDKNINFNKSINRTNIQTMPANGGPWQHNATHRKGVPYSNPTIAQKYNRATPAQQVQARQAYRGYGGTVSPPQNQPAQNRGQEGLRPDAQPGQRPAHASAGGARDRGPGPEISTRQAGAFDGVGSPGVEARAQASRGESSRAAGNRGGGRGLRKG